MEVAKTGKPALQRKRQSRATGHGVGDGFYGRTADPDRRTVFGLVFGSVETLHHPPKHIGKSCMVKRKSRLQTRGVPEPAVGPRGIDRWVIQCCQAGP